MIQIRIGGYFISMLCTEQLLLIVRIRWKSCITVIQHIENQLLNGLYFVVIFLYFRGGIFMRPKYNGIESVSKLIFCFNRKVRNPDH
jgi:hypothetical protein